jgi:hypothetical protein
MASPIDGSEHTPTSSLVRCWAPSWGGCDNSRTCRGRRPRTANPRLSIAAFPRTMMSRPLPKIVEVFARVQVLLSLLVLCCNCLGCIGSIDTAFRENQVAYDRAHHPEYGTGKTVEEQINESQGRRFPFYTAYLTVSAILSWVLSIAALVGVKGLMEKKVWGRPLSLIVGLALILHQLAGTVYWFFVLLPSLQENTGSERYFLLDSLFAVTSCLYIVFLLVYVCALLFPSVAEHATEGERPQRLGG